MDAFSVGDWQVEPSLRTLTSAERQVHLEPKVMRVLVLLAEHAGRVVSKQQLLASVWPDTFVGDEVLARTISELRRVFRDDARAPRYVQTIPKGGYRLIAPVRGAFPPESSATTPLPVGRHRRRFGRLVAAAILGAAIVWTAAVSIRTGGTRREVRAKDAHLVNEALQLISVDKHAAAAALAREAIRENPRDPFPHLVLAWALANNGDRPEAYLSSAKRAIELASSTGEPEIFYFARGSYWEMKGDLEQAARDYETLLKVAPQHYWGLNNLMGVYRVLGRDEWKHLLLRRADAAPANSTDQVEAARVLLTAGDLRGSERYAARACERLTSTSEIETRFAEPWACAVPAYTRWLDGRPLDVRAQLQALLANTKLQTPERDMALHTAIGAGLAIGDFELARAIAAEIHDSLVRWQDEAAVALVAGDRDLARRLLLHQGLTSPLLLQSAAVAADVQGVGISLERYGVESFAPDSADVLYVRAEEAWSEGRHEDAAQLVGPTMQRADGALTGPDYGRSTIAVLRSLFMLAESAEREGNLSQAVTHMQEAHVLRREACRGEPLAPALWLRAEVTLADLYRRLGRAELAVQISKNVDALLSEGSQSQFFSSGGH